MELNVYDVITGVVTSTKSFDAHTKQGLITFWVNKLANKIMIRQAVEKIWDVKVDDVRVINVHGKVKAFARKAYVSADRKKAIVKLKKGFAIEIPGMYERIGVKEQEPVAVVEEGK